MATRVRIDPLTSLPQLEPVAAPEGRAPFIRQTSIRVPGGLQRLAPLSGQLADLIGVVRRRQGREAIAEAEEFVQARPGETEEQRSRRVQAQFRAYLAENPDAPVTASPVFLQALGREEGERGLGDLAARLQDPSVYAEGLDVDDELGGTKRPSKTPEQIWSEQLQAFQQTEAYQDNPWFRQGFNERLNELRADFLADMTRRQGAELERKGLEVFEDKATLTANPLSMTGITEETLRDTERALNLLIQEGRNGAVPRDTVDKMVARLVEQAATYAALDPDQAVTYLTNLQGITLDGNRLNDPNNRFGREFIQAYDSALQFQDARRTQARQAEAETLKQDIRKVGAVATRHLEAGWTENTARRLFESGALRGIMERYVEPENVEDAMRAYLSLFEDYGKTVEQNLESDPQVLSALANALAERDEDGSRDIWQRAKRDGQLSPNDLLTWQALINNTFDLERQFAGDPSDANLSRLLANRSNPQLEGTAGEAENAKWIEFRTEISNERDLIRDAYRDDPTTRQEKLQELYNRTEAKFNERDNFYTEKRTEWLRKWEIDNSKGVISPELFDDDWEDLKWFSEEFDLDGKRTKNRQQVDAVDADIDRLDAEMREELREFIDQEMLRELDRLRQEAVEAGQTEEQIAAIGVDPDYAKTFTEQALDAASDEFLGKVEQVRLDTGVPAGGFLKFRRDTKKSTLDKAKGEFTPDQVFRAGTKKLIEAWVQDPDKEWTPITVAPALGGVVVGEMAPYSKIIREDLQAGRTNGRGRRYAASYLDPRPRLILAPGETPVTPAEGGLEDRPRPVLEDPVLRARHATELFSHVRMTKASEQAAGRIAVEYWVPGVKRTAFNTRAYTPYGERRRIEFPLSSTPDVQGPEIHVPLETPLDWVGFDPSIETTSYKEAARRAFAELPERAYEVYRLMGGTGAPDSQEYKEWQAIQIKSHKDR